MNVENFFSQTIKVALQNNPPGQWMTSLPEQCIRLNSGYPNPTLVPVQEIKAAVNNLLEEESDLPLQYLGSPKMAKLKEQIQARLIQRGIQVSNNELIITSGACQAIDLISRIIIDENTLIAIEAPTYMEALEVFQNYTNQLISIPVDELGMQTSILEKILVERKRGGETLPRLLYTIPTHQNPTGTTLSKKRREHLIQLAEMYQFIILEDDAYGELSFHHSPPPLKTLDQKGLVLHVGSLSKVVAPGMRIGWVAGSSEFIKTLAWLKKDLDHPFAQATMATFLETTDWDKRLNLLRKSYEKTCNALLAALEHHLSDRASWYVPKGGYFVWLHLEGVDTSQLLTKALAKGVAFVPGEHFFLQPEDGLEFLRLSFSYAHEQQITEGVQKLAQVLS